MYAGTTDLSISWKFLHECRCKWEKNIRTVVSEVVEGGESYCNKSGKGRYWPVEDPGMNIRDTRAAFCKYLVSADVVFSS